MAKGRADVSFQAIADAITKVETAVRGKEPINAQHLQFLDGLRSILEGFCRTQAQIRPAACGDYCFIAPSAARSRKKRARR